MIFPPPPIRTAMVDPNGMIAAPWLQWFRTLYERSGGAIAPTNNDLGEDMPEDAGTEEIRASMFALTDEFLQVPVQNLCNTCQFQPDQERIAALEAQVAALETTINDIRQGAII